MSEPIVSFTGAHSYLSNFFPCDVAYEGRTYPSLECAYQAAKTLDEEARKPFQAMKPGKAKRAGRRLALRPGWDAVKLNVMLYLLRDKFARHDAICVLLASTGDAMLVEGNHWGDKYWGAVEHMGRFVGENHLGRLLMQVREELKG